MQNFFKIKKAKNCEKILSFYNFVDRHCYVFITHTFGYNNIPEVSASIWLLYETSHITVGIVFHVRYSKCFPYPHLLYHTKNSFL